MSSSRSPGASCSLRQISSSLRSCAVSSIVAGRCEVGAGVDQRRSEEQPVERVGDVVVVADGAPVARRRVQATARTSLGSGPRAGADRRGAGGRDAGRGRGQPVREAYRRAVRSRWRSASNSSRSRRAQGAGHVGAGEAELVGLAEQIADRLAPHVEDPGRPAVRRRGQLAAVPEAQRHRNRGQAPAAEARKHSAGARCNSARSGVHVTGVVVLDVRHSRSSSFSSSSASASLGRTSSNPVSATPHCLTGTGRQGKRARRWIARSAACV